MNYITSEKIGYFAFGVGVGAMFVFVLIVIFGCTGGIC